MTKTPQVPAISGTTPLGVSPYTGNVKVTVRGNGKAHRAWRRPDGSFYIACSCPGSNRGYLRNRVRVIAEGWDHATCKSR